MAVWKEGIRVVCFSFSFRIFSLSFVSHCCGNLEEIDFIRPAKHKGKNARGYSVSLKVLCESCSTGIAVCLGWDRDCVELQQGWDVWVIHTKQSLQSKYCLVFQVVIAWTNWGRFSWREQQQWQQQQQQKSLPENHKDSILKLADSGVSTLQSL